MSFYSDFIQNFPYKIWIKFGKSEFLKILDKIQIKLEKSHFIQILFKFYPDFKKKLTLSKFYPDSSRSYPDVIWIKFGSNQDERT